MGSVQQQWFDQVGVVLETLNQGVIINDDRRRVVFANSMFLEMIKMRAENLLGRRITELFPPEDVPRLLEFIERREAEGRARYEFYIPQSDGGRLPVVVTARQVRATDGQAFGIVTATDISEQKRAEMELRRANLFLEARQREIEAELLLAARVQQSLAPQTLTWGGVAVETFYQPVRTIGGDFGLVVPGDHHLNLLVCDVSGHGISSALVANRIYTEAMSQIERRAGLAQMLRHLNRFVIQTVSSSAFYFTLATARLSRDGRWLEFAGAGHPPAMIVRPGLPPRLLESHSGLLGFLEDAVVGEATIKVPLQALDRVMIYTDGLTESFNSRRQMLGIDGLSEIVRDASSLPLAQMKQQILNRVAAWREGPAADDVSLVLIELS